LSRARLPIPPLWLFHLPFKTLKSVNFEVFGRILIPFDHWARGECGVNEGANLEETFNISRPGASPGHFLLRKESQNTVVKYCLSPAQDRCELFLISSPNKPVANTEFNES
jgi:hypothetical protein